MHQQSPTPPQLLIFKTLQNWLTVFYTFSSRQQDKLNPSNPTLQCDRRICTLEQTVTFSQPVKADHDLSLGEERQGREGWDIMSLVGSHRRLAPFEPSNRYNNFTKNTLNMFTFSVSFLGSLYSIVDLFHCMGDVCITATYQQQCKRPQRQYDRSKKTEKRGNVTTLRFIVKRSSLLLHFVLLEPPTIGTDLWSDQKCHYCWLPCSGERGGGRKLDSRGHANVIFGEL